ncbi:MAG: hypothetical protein ABEJ87_05520 [Candidatus Nanohalobium sp.]
MHVIVLIPIVLANAVIAGLSLLIYRELREHGDTAMASLKLHPGNTVTDFKIMMYAHGFEALVLLMVLYAGLIGNGPLVDIGRQLSVLYGLTFAVVFYRWYRRF